VKEFLSKLCLSGNAAFIEPQVLCSNCPDYFYIQKVVTEPCRISARPGLEAALEQCLYAPEAVTP